MKKILLLAATAMINVAASANTDIIQIVDANGNDVSNTTINITEADGSEDFYGDIIYAMHSNLSVKNLTDQLIQCKVPYEITEISHGEHQICFNQCEVKSTVGKYEGQFGALKAGALRELKAEYFPMASSTKGKCVVVYKPEIYTAELAADGVTLEYTFIAEGPTVTVNYLFGDAGVEDVIANKEEVTSTYYDFSGRKINNPTNGLYIKRTTFNDGSIENAKVLVK